MAISTYAELKTAIADFLNREDLTSMIPTFIALAESKINRDVRHWRMESRAETEIDSQFHALPTDWLETIRFHTNGDGTNPIELISMSQMQKRRTVNDDASGRPSFYAHVGGQFEFYPTPDGTYSSDLLYYAKLSALSDSNTTNWLLSEAPEVYLYGSLLHSAPYLQEDERIQTWGALYLEAAGALNDASNAAKWSGSGMRMKVNSY